MKFLILMFLVLAIQIALVSSETAAQEAFKEFSLASMKMAISRNADFIHADYEQIDRNGLIIHKSETAEKITKASAEEIEERKKRYQGFLELKNWPWKYFNVEFTRDGFLHVRSYTHDDGTISSVSLAIRDSSIEGGYKLYRSIDV